MNYRSPSEDILEESLTTPKVVILREKIRRKSLRKRCKNNTGIRPRIRGFAERM